MTTFTIQSIGCKVNQYESQQIRTFLEDAGLQQVSVSQNPHLAIINSCCVTSKAAAKSRQQIRKARKLNPNAVVVICGCMPKVQSNQINELLNANMLSNNPKPSGSLGENINEPLGTNSGTDKLLSSGSISEYFGEKVRFITHRHTIAAQLSEIIADQTASGPKNHQNSTETALRTRIRPEKNPKIKHKSLSNQQKLPQLTSFKGHTRAFLKAQDGCDGQCSYCIIPKARPDVHSKPLEYVLKEAQDLVNSGHKEIVITGIFLGAYGQKTVRRDKWPNSQNDKLAELLERLAQVPGLARIRLSSLEPSDVSEKLLDVFCKYSNIMPHLHLSLQSGSNSTLKRMCRQYSADDFLRTVEVIKTRLDRPAITTDIIVGFPGETDDDFQQTVELVERVGFSRIHVFSFSAHQGTAAAKMKDAVPSRIKKERSEILQNKGLELGYKFREQFIGETAEVLIEDFTDLPSGRCERYFPVIIENSNSHLKKNDLVEVRLIKNTPNEVLGRII